MERRTTEQASARVAVEDRGEGKSPEIVGYAAVYYDGTERTEFNIFDDLIERIMPGAFDRAIAERDDARALFNHNADHVLGRVSAGTVTLQSDKTGLRYEIRPGETSIAKDVMEHIRRGDVQGSSFKFVVTEQVFRTVDEIDIREIVSAEVLDVGPVTYPAYEATTADVRSGDCEDAKAAREEWRSRSRLVERRYREYRMARFHGSR